MGKSIRATSTAATPARAKRQPARRLAPKRRFGKKEKTPSLMERLRRIRSRRKGATLLDLRRHSATGWGIQRRACTIQGRQRHNPLPPRGARACKVDWTDREIPREGSRRAREASPARRVVVLCAQAADGASKFLCAESRKCLRLCVDEPGADSSPSAPLLSHEFPALQHGSPPLWAALSVEDAVPRVNCPECQVRPVDHR